MAPSPSPVLPQTKKRKTWLWVLISVLVVIAIVAGLFIWWLMGGSSGNPKGVAEDWLRDLSSSKVTEAYDMTASGFKEGTSAEQFNTFLQAYPIMTSVKEVKFSGVERTSGNGQTISTLTGTLTGTDGKTSPIKIMLIAEDGDWKIYNVDLRGLQE
ncbi:MAG: DUF4864 domain-containing protein [Candidatus Andersenbacteria bacterium]